MITTNPLIRPGICDSLMDHPLQQILTENPDLHAVLAKIDTEEQPSRYVTFVARLLK